MLLLVYALIGLVGAITAISLFGFNIDLALSALFYDPGRNDFLASKNSSFALFRDHGVIAVITCATLVGLAMQRSGHLPKVPGRAALFLALSLVLAPGLLVNAVLKDNWGRPRPGMIVEFGGQQKYVDWWDLRGTCRTNCSLASGEAASAAWMFGPAMIAPAPWRAAAMAGAAVFTVTMSLLRLAAGGHFLTDVLLGVLITLIVLLATYRLVFRGPWAWSRNDAAVPTGAPTR